MINLAYFKYIFKANFKLMLLFSLVLCIFLTVMCNVFTVSTIDSLQTAADDTIVANMLTSNGTLVGFMSNSFYSLMAIIFPMVYSIVVANSLICQKIDRTNMACFLSTPITRNKITISSCIYLVLSIIIMWTLASITGIVASSIFQPNQLDIDKFLLLNLGVFLYHFAISSICFISSCIFNTTKNSLLISAGIPLTFFVISLLIKLSEDLDVLKYFTLNTLFDTTAILSGGDYILKFIIMLVIGIGLYTIGIIYFNKKDLPL